MKLLHAPTYLSVKLLSSFRINISSSWFPGGQFAYTLPPIIYVGLLGVSDSRDGGLNCWMAAGPNSTKNLHKDNEQRVFRRYSYTTTSEDSDDASPVDDSCGMLCDSYGFVF